MRRVDVTILGLTLVTEGGSATSTAPTQSFSGLVPSELPTQSLELYRLELLGFFSPTTDYETRTDVGHNFAFTGRRMRNGSTGGSNRRSHRSGVA